MLIKGIRCMLPLLQTDICRGASCPGAAAEVLCGAQAAAAASAAEESAIMAARHAGEANTANARAAAISAAQSYNLVRLSPCPAVTLRLVEPCPCVVRTHEGCQLLCAPHPHLSCLGKHATGEPFLKGPMPCIASQEQVMALESQACCSVSVD